MSTISSGLALCIRLTSIVLRQISEKILFIKVLCKYHWIGAQMSLFSEIKFSWRKFRKRFELVLSSKGNISNITSSDIDQVPQWEIRKKTFKNCAQYFEYCCENVFFFTFLLWLPRTDVARFSNVYSSAAVISKEIFPP